MKRALLIALFATGCVNTADQFRAAAPTQAAVTLNLPSSGVSASERGPVSPQVIGQRAGFYSITRAVTVVVNGGVGVTLLLLEAIVAQEPTTIGLNHAEWGPYTDALSPSTWKFDVNKVGAIDYTYALSGKPKTAPDSAYQAVISGSAHAVSRTVGSGDFSIAFAALAATDPNNHKAQGGITAHYDNTSFPRVVEVAFKGFDDGNGSYTPDGALYKYVENADHSGEFDFVAKGDVDHDALAMPEVLAMKSRWLPTGQGVSAVSASGGSLAAPATAAECWSASFAETYFTDTWNASDTQGNPSSCSPAL
jgi:hypothetical protein